MYKNKCERMVISTLRQMFILFLGHNSLAYGSRCFSMHYSVYCCNVYTYFPDESIV
jgi:hypothetical protein